VYFNFMAFAICNHHLVWLVPVQCITPFAANNHKVASPVPVQWHLPHEVVK